jgi:hypothetical protein
MVKRTPQEWRDLIQKQAESGQTATEFCAARSINPKYFSLQKNKLRIHPSKKPRKEKPPSHFITLKPPVSADSIALHFGALQLKIPTHISPQWLAELMRGLN